MSEKIDIEIVRDSDGRYYANMLRDGIKVEGLPEYVTYRELRRAIEKQTGFRILPLNALKMHRFGRKYYGYFNNYEKHDSIWDSIPQGSRLSAHNRSSSAMPDVFSAGTASEKETMNAMQEEWTDYCDEHIMLLRHLPALSGNAFECLKIVSHPDEDGTVSVLHETIFIDDYIIDNCRGEIALCEILAGFGYTSLDDYVRDHNGDDDWVYREDNTVDREASPSWYIDFLDLASFICESHDHGLKMTPESAKQTFHRITGKDYSIDWFRDLAGFSPDLTADSFNHRIYNASARKIEPSSFKAVPFPQREPEH